MRTIKVIAVMSVLATLTLFVGTVPGSAADSFDLTAGPVTVSYTLDLTNAPDVALDNNWANMGAVGLFGEGGVGAQMVGFLYDWDKLTQLPEPKLDNDDKFNMQEPAAARWSESSYDVPCSGPSAGTVGAVVGSGDNYGVWFDRDGVDQWQATMWGAVNGGTYNTGGVYQVALTFAKSPTAGHGYVCATVNGIGTGFTRLADGSYQYFPYGLSFAATDEQMQEMEVVSSAGDDGIVITNLDASGVPSFTRDQGDCPDGATFVSSTTSTPVALTTLPGHKYEIDVSGTFYAGGTSTFDIQADAEYSQDAVQRAAGDPWTVAVRNYESYGEELLDLLVDGQIIDWGQYSPTHEYSMQKVATGGTIEFEFAIYDVFYPNNTGGLCVSMEDLGNIGTFEGFFAPVDNNMMNVAKAGQAIPLKWRLLDYNGVAVDDLAAVKVTVASLSCASGETSDALEEYAAGGSDLQYLGDGYWQFNWKTPKSYANSCKTMTLQLLGDGSTHTAEFQFK